MEEKYFETVLMATKLWVPFFIL